MKQAQWQTRKVKSQTVKSSSVNPSAIAVRRRTNVCISSRFSFHFFIFSLFLSWARQPTMAATTRQHNRSIGCPEPSASLEKSAGIQWSRRFAQATPAQATLPLGTARQTLPSHSFSIYKIVICLGFVNIGLLKVNNPGTIPMLE